MASVTAFTADRSKEIEDNAIIDGEVDEDGHLILTRFDTTTIDAGSVIGPEGPIGMDPAIVVCTSITRPTGGDLFAGLHIYETDTKLVYVYDGAAWRYASGIYICTSVTRPPGSEGLPIWETDTNKYLIHNGVRFDPPWNLPWGYVGSTALSGGANNAGGLLTGDVDFTTVGNRVYRVQVQCSIYTNTDIGTGVVKLFYGASELARDTDHSGGVAGSDTQDFDFEVVFSPAAGVVDLGVQYIAPQATVRNVDPGLKTPGMHVFDLGPNAAPA